MQCYKKTQQLERCQGERDTWQPTTLPVDSAQALDVEEEVALDIRSAESSCNISRMEHVTATTQGTQVRSPLVQATHRNMRTRESLLRATKYVVVGYGIDSRNRHIFPTSLHFSKIKFYKPEL